MKNFTRDTGGAVDEDEDHTPEDPRDSDGTNSGAYIPAVDRVHLAIVSDHRQNDDVQKQQSRHKLSDDSSVKRPFPELLHVDHRRRQRIKIVFPRRRPPTSDFDVAGRHCCRISVNVNVK